MKTNKIIAGIAALALAAPMFTSSVFAAWDGAAVNAGTGTTVSYDNSTNIPDPDHPGNPQWAVKVPSSIKFTDANKKVDATVSIESINGGTMPSYPLYVSVKSSNGYKLNLTGNKDPLDYDLQYGGKSVKAEANKAVDLGTFTANTADKSKIIGTATLSSTQSATETGSHTDTLTYMISKTATPAS